jgi:hypothetical protein
LAGRSREPVCAIADGEELSTFFVIDARSSTPRHLVVHVLLAYG